MVIGPSPGPTFQHVVTTTCLPIVAAREDCLGSTTIWRYGNHQQPDLDHKRTDHGPCSRQPGLFGQQRSARWPMVRFPGSSQWGDKFHSACNGDHDGDQSGLRGLGCRGHSNREPAVEYRLAYVRR